MPKQRRIFEAEAIARGIQEKPARSPARPTVNGAAGSSGNSIKKPDDYLTREIILRLIEWIKQV